MSLANLRVRLNQVLEQLESPKFLDSDGLGNEIGFWIFDYPAEHELVIREELEHITKRLKKRHTFAHINLFAEIIALLDERGLFERACEREKQVGLEALKKNLAGPLQQDKIAKYLSQKYDLRGLDFIMVSGLGNAWPLLRGHEFLSAMQDVMGHTPLVLFYPGTYSGLNLQPFGEVESRNYYRAFKLVP